jgi:membrane-associated protease RseP (regulator of RpoE activity)
MESVWISLASVVKIATWLGAVALLTSSSFWISILIHEIGHALAARLCRFGIFEFRVGSGKPLGTSRFGSCVCSWSILPYGGMIRCFPFRPGSYRFRSFVVFLAGPAANVAVAAFIYALPIELSLDYSSVGNIPVVCVTGLACVSAFLTIVNTVQSTKP